MDSLKYWSVNRYLPKVRAKYPDLVDKFHPGYARVLEVGCAEGEISIRFARGSRRDVVGIDINAEAIREAESRVSGQSTIDWVRFKCCKFLDFEDPRQFGIIVMIRFLTCLDRAREWESSLEHANSLLAPKGLLYIHDFLHDDSSPIYGKRYSEGRKCGLPIGSFHSTNECGSFVAHHHTESDIQWIEGMFRREFFESETGFSMNGNPCKMFQFLGRKIDSKGS